jgi:hypothetical protein
VEESRSRYHPYSNREEMCKMINSGGVAQNAKKAYINHPHSQSRDPDTLAKYVMCLDGAWEVWLDQMEEDTLFNMHNWEAANIKRSNKRR